MSLPLQHADFEGQIDVRNQLRLATQQQHRSLDQHPMVAGLTQADYPLSRYRQLLQTYLPLYQTLETAINAYLHHQPAGFDYLDRNKAAWLSQDLSHFQDLSAGRPQPHSRHINSLGELIGILYVLEGATLGGAYIAKALKQHHGLDQHNGARFFHGYGELTQEKWQALIQFSQIIAADQSQRQAAESAAIATFSLFAQALNQCQGHDNPVKTP
jgi:heme oxygenase